MDYDSDIIQSVMDAAEAGAEFVIAKSRQDIIDKARTEVALEWERCRYNRESPPADLIAWARSRGQKIAERILAAEISSHHSPAGDESGRKTSESMDRLIGISTEIINRKASGIERQIIELHYNEHLTLKQISIRLEICEDEINKRWSHLLWSVADEIIDIVRSDETLSSLYRAIVDDDNDFPGCLARLLSIASKGISAISEVILP